MRRLWPLLLWAGACHAAALLSAGRGPLLPLITTGAPIIVPNPLGINLEGIAYFATEMPFINVMKQGGMSSATNYNNGWYTQTSGTFDTHEEAYLNLDTDGYPTTLTMSPAPPGGQVFTKTCTLISFNIGSAAPGASAIYPGGTYRLKYEGLGTVTITGDGSASLSNASANTYVSTTFTVTPSNSGMVLCVTAINSGTDYPRDISLMLQSSATAYDAGAIFSPTFLTMLAPFSSLRFMDWMNTNGEFLLGIPTATVSSGATSLTLTAAWFEPTGVYPVTFIDGEQRNMTLTLGSTAAIWTGGLSNTISSASSWVWGSQTYFGAFFVQNHTFATRPKPSNAFWDNVSGVPLEVIVSLCNTLQANCHLNVPLAYTDAEMTSMAQLVMSGTGMQGSYTALSSTVTATVELSNEVWNCFTFEQCNAAASLGAAAWPAQPSGGGNVNWQRNWYGMRVAQMATDWQSAVGTTLFTRVFPTLGGQAGNTSSASDALATAYWVSGPASAHPIKSIAIAPYWGTNPSATDCTTMTGVTTPLDDFFAIMASQTGTSGNGSHTYTSVPSGGWYGQTQGFITSYASLISGTYPSLKLIAYEGGNNFFACSTIGSGGLCNSQAACTGWPALVTSAERDARMGATYVTMLTYWSTHAGALAANVFNVYDDVNVIGPNGAFGLLESIMQPISPLSGAPTKYNSAVTYIQ